MALAEPIPRPVLPRAWMFVTGLMAIIIAASLIVTDRGSVVVWLVLTAVIVAISALAIRQPGTYLYAYDDRVGLRTTFGSRYEVRRGDVHTVRVGSVSWLGTPALGVALEDDRGKVMLSHALVYYDDHDLEEFAARIGASLALS